MHLGRVLSSGRAGPGGTATAMLVTPLFARPPTAVSLSFYRTPVSSAKFQKRHRRKPPNDADDDSDTMGGIGVAVLTALDSRRLPRNGGSSGLPLPGASPMAGAPSRDGKRERQREMPTKKGETSTSGRESTSLSGLDVLLALQSASAQKSSVARRRSGSKPKRQAATEEAGFNSGDVRPITIRSDWAVRLRKLESLLEDLTTNAV